MPAKVLNNNKKTNWKDWVDWWPTYLVLGVAIAHLIDRTQILPILHGKVFGSKNPQQSSPNSDTDPN